MDENSFGELIRRLREDKEITLRSMADKIGISAAYLSRIERDRENPPTEGIIKKLAVILEVEDHKLFAAANKMTKEDWKYFGKSKMPQFLRIARERNLSDEQIQKLINKMNEEDS